MSTFVSLPFTFAELLLLRWFVQLNGWWICIMWYCYSITDIYIPHAACTLNDNKNVQRLTCNINQYQATNRNVLHGSPILNLQLQRF